LLHRIDDSPFGMKLVNVVVKVIEGYERPEQACLHDAFRQPHHVEPIKQRSDAIAL
jgi:hypothetical protein